jgi:hypothetical protein
VSNNIYLFVNVGPLIHELPFLAPTSKNIVKLNTLCIVFFVFGKKFWQECPFKILNGTTSCSSFEFQVQKVFLTRIFCKEDKIHRLESNFAAKHHVHH